MLYYLFTYLHESFDLPGAGVFQYISFRTAMAIIFTAYFNDFWEEDNSYSRSEASG